VSSDREFTVLTDAEKTKAVYQKLISRRPVTVNGKLPTLDDIRAVIRQDYDHADAYWKVSARRKVVSRYISNLFCTLHMNGDIGLRYNLFYCNQSVY